MEKLNIEDKKIKNILIQFILLKWSEAVNEQNYYKEAFWWIEFKKINGTK